MDWWTVILSGMTGTLVIYYIYSQKFGKLEKLGILHVKPVPIFGNMAGALFRQYPFVEVIDKIYKLNEKAKYVGLYDFGEPVIMIRSPELIKNIAVKNFDHFIDHRGFADAEQDPLFGKNLFGLRGEKWRETRSLLSPAFTSKKIKVMFKLMWNCGKNFVDYFLDGTSLNVVNTKDAFTRYTNDVIATCAFGITIDSLRDPKNDFYVFSRESTNFEGSLGLKLFVLRNFPKISKFFGIKLVDKRVEKFFENVVRDAIETRDREGIIRPDMIQLMMETRKNKCGKGPEFTIQDMTAQAFAFLLGGYDTTSTLMCFAAYAIATNLEIQKKLHDEIDKILEESDNEPTYEVVNGMQYLDAVLNETLRIYPPISFLDRVCVKRFELPPSLQSGASVIIEPGQNVWFPVHSIHRDEKYFFQPDKFVPERFMGSAKNDIDPFTYLPFGQGPRICIGIRFALLETKVLLFHLLAKYHFKPGPKTRVPFELTTRSFAMAPKDGFSLQFESRDPTKKGIF